MLIHIFYNVYCVIFVEVHSGLFLLHVARETGMLVSWKLQDSQLSPGY